MTWQFQVGSLAKKHSDYIPDLFFFGGSYSDKSDRSPAFQAHCLVKGLTGFSATTRKRSFCGFSYGGMVAFKIVEEYPEMVRAMVVSGFESSEDLLLPTSVKGLKTPFALAVHKSMWFPNRLFKDYLK
uniref:AB hydrolase-1 domain-containing protein n=1 Tax=Brassica oleracea var. oleracea TaxID=109376 RepID=A0A0D3E3A8_BRAOL